LDYIRHARGKSQRRYVEALTLPRAVGIQTIVAKSQFSEKARRKDRGEPNDGALGRRVGCVLRDESDIVRRLAGRIGYRRRDVEASKKLVLVGQGIVDAAQIHVVLCPACSGGE